MKKTIEQIDVAGKRVLMRVDFNVPIKNGKITDDRRIQMTLPSLLSVLDRGGTLTLMSHLGRPSGTGFEQEFSLIPVANRLSELLDRSVVCADDDVSSPIVILENLRFNKGEIENDEEFARHLASMGDIYCNDAFGTAHREHASMVAVPNAMVGKPRVAGVLLARELQYLDRTIANAQKPFVAVLGGSKVSDKMDVIENLIDTVDTILIGGAMAYTFLLARGEEVGASLVEVQRIEDARAILDIATSSSTEVLLPHDHVCAQQVEHESPVQVVNTPIPEGWIGVDIGPETVAKYSHMLMQAKTIVWNGPVGVFEIEPFDLGTRHIAEAIAMATNDGAISIAGGGDTSSAISSFGLDGQMTHISSGGGASLQMLGGKAFSSVVLLDEIV
ncbi:MAG TPA: phosphoglycerate kinase [Phycisphaerales bacterium]|nr:phosphoglycerate kinase [Phycisphaerales bacterium]